VKKMNMDDVAKAMQNNTEQPFLDAIGKAEAAAYVASAPYIQHMQFPPLTARLDALSVRLTKLQQDLFDMKDKVAKAESVSRRRAGERPILRGGLRFARSHYDGGPPQRPERPDYDACGSRQLAL
jgi:hypothetical protein